MRKLLVALFALGLIVAFVAPAYATDVSVSGTYRVRGWWESNHAMLKDGTSSTAEVSNDWYDQRLRVQSVFNVEDGLSLTVRFDALERVWGTNDTTTTTTTGTTGATTTIPAHDHSYTYADTTYDKSANIQFGRVYVTAKTAIGKFDVGYMSGGTWGTIFQDDEADGVPRIKYTGVFGPVIVLALTEKGAEVDGLAGSTRQDADYDKYALAGIYKWQGGQAGVLWFYLPMKNTSNGATGYKLTRNYIAPYFKATIGSLYLEGEASYYGGEFDYDNPATQDKDIEGYSWYLYGKFNMGPAFVGFQYAHVDGDDPTTYDVESGYPDTADWDPCLILFNYWLAIYQGALGGAADTGWTGLTNGDLYQIFAGFSPMEKLTLSASLTYAVADQKPTGYVDDEYGYEFDVTATYKIFDHLEYMIGFGYLAAGDYFKKTDATAQIEDDYLIMHQLQLSF